MILIVVIPSLPTDQTLSLGFFSFSFPSSSFLLFCFFPPFSLSHILILFSLRHEDMMRDWHHRFPVTEAEKERNQIIYDHYQYNHNPFVVCPWLVDLVCDF